MRPRLLSSLVAFVLILLGVATAARQAGTQPSYQPITSALAGARIGETLSVAGRATVATGVLQARNLFIAIESGRGALWLYRRDLPIRVREGDSVEARGVLRTYRGSLELVVSSVRVVPTVAPVDVAPDSAWPGTPLHEGRLIRVEGVVGEIGESEGGRWLRLHRRGAHDSLTLWMPWTHRAPPPIDDIRTGDDLVVTGLLTLFQDNPSDAPVVQMVPRRAADVRELGFPRSLTRRLTIGALILLLLAGLVLATTRVVTHRHGTALRETEQRYRQLLQLSPDAVLVHDGARVLFANAAAARLLGATDEHALAGRAVDTFVAPSERRALDASRASSGAGLTEPRVRTTLRTSESGSVESRSR